MQRINFQDPPKTAPKRTNITRREENIEPKALAVNRQNTLLHRNSQWHILIRDKTVYELDVSMMPHKMAAIPWANEDVV